MPVATQVKRRRGTAEENNAFTGAEGEITVDLTNKTLRVHDGETLGGTAVETQRNKSTTISKESTDAQYPSAKAVVDYVSSNSGGAMPVGAIFTTPRTGTIQGAVEANGSPYNIADYSGEGSIGALLAAGSIAYVSKTEFQTQVTNTGACDSFGWNGDGDTTFLVPKLNPWHIKKSAPVIGNGTSLTLKKTGASNEDAIYIAPESTKYGAMVFTAGGVGYAGVGITTDPTKSGMIADLSETTNLRVMVQLATGVTDQALETCTSVLSDVSALNAHRVIEFQAPTAENNYTWYRKYADGWVEMGQKTTTTTNALTTITLPVELANTNYTLNITPLYMNSGAVAAITVFAITTTNFTVWGNQFGSTGYWAVPFAWQVSGMSAQ